MKKSKTSQEILNDDSMDIASLAKAHAEIQSTSTFAKQPPSMQRSLLAWARLKAKRQLDEGWRQRIKSVWKKKS